MGQIIAYDTNIFIYWLDFSSPFFDKSLAALKLLESPDVSAVTSALTVTELTASLNSTAVTTLYTVLGNKLEFLPVDVTIAERAGAFLRKHKTLRIPDAIHLATALSSGASIFMTNDHNLAKLSVGIKIQLLQNL